MLDIKAREPRVRLDSSTAAQPVEQPATQIASELYLRNWAAAWLRILENFKIKIRNTTKISKYKIHFEKAKISKYDKISRFSKIFRNLVRRISAIFQVFTHFLQFFRIDFEKS